jgi:hypothetical protein
VDGHLRHLEGEKGEKGEVKRCGASAFFVLFSLSRASYAKVPKSGAQIVTPAEISREFQFQ